MLKILIYFLKKFFFSSKKEWKRFDNLFMVLGIVISVAILTAALALFQGYQKTLKETILGFNSHLYIFKDSNSDFTISEADSLMKLLNKREEVVSSSAIVMAQVMLSKGERIKGGMIRGIDWKSNTAIDYKNYVQEGDWRLKNPDDVVIGKQLALNLDLSIGDTLNVISPLNSSKTVFGIIPLKKKFRVTGIFKSGMFEYDSSYIFMNSLSASRFTSSPGKLNMIEVKLTPDFIDKADYEAYVLASILGTEYQIRSWIFFNSSLFMLLQIEKYVMIIILSFLILIASFNIISTISANIIEKKREIGILMAIGMKLPIIKSMFMIKSFLLNSSSILLGMFSGILLGKIITAQTLITLKSDVYFIDKFTVSFPIENLLLIFFISIIIVLISTYVALRKINGIEIVEILRNE